VLVSLMAIVNGVAAMTVRPWSFCIGRFVSPLLCLFRYVFLCC